MASNWNERLRYIEQFGLFSSIHRPFFAISPLLLNLIDCNKHCTEANVHRISKNGFVLFYFLSTRRQCLFCVERYAKLNNEILGKISILFERYLWAHTSIPFGAKHTGFFLIFYNCKRILNTCFDEIVMHMLLYMYLCAALSVHCVGAFRMKIFWYFQIQLIIHIYTHLTQLPFYCCACFVVGVIVWLNERWTQNMAIYFNFMKEHWWWETM